MLTILCHGRASGSDSKKARETCVAGEGRYRFCLQARTSPPRRQTATLCTVEEGVYVGAMLPFGLRSATTIFTAIADGLQWIARQTGVELIEHYLHGRLHSDGRATCTIHPVNKALTSSSRRVRNSAFHLPSTSRRAHAPNLRFWLGNSKLISCFPSSNSFHRHAGGR